MEYYFLTVNKNYSLTAKMSEDHYDWVFDTLQRNSITVDSFSFERGDHQKRLHLHVILYMHLEDALRLDENQTWIKKGYKTDIHKCENVYAARQYIKKDVRLF